MKYLFTCFYSFRVCFNFLVWGHYYPLKHQPQKMVKHTQTIRREIADGLFECV